MKSCGQSVVTPAVGDTTSAAPPERAVGDDADLPRPGAGAAEAFEDDDAAGPVRSSAPWWTRAPAGLVHRRAATPLLPDLADLLRRRQGR
jgi:hypothetical protein